MPSGFDYFRRPQILKNRVKADLLLQELQSVTDFSENDFPEFLKLFVPFTVKKNDFFYKAGEIPKYSPFIVKGCMRKYFVNEAGEEQIIYFAEESWFAGEVDCMRAKKPTIMNLQALEDCEIFGITIEDSLFAQQKYPEYQKYFFIRYPQSHSNLINEAARIKNDPPEVSYLRLLKERPTLINRVPSIHIANYLGVSPETISRIRHKIAKGKFLD